MTEEYLEGMLEELDDPPNFEALLSHTSYSEMERTGSPSAAKRPRLSNISGTCFANFIANSSRTSYSNIKEECSMMKEDSEDLISKSIMPEKERLEDETIDDTHQHFSPANDQEAVKNPKHVDFPFLLASTDKGNVMLVTESQTPGFRHHWSLHSRRPQKEEGRYLERFACINCKKLSRQTQSSSFAPCLTLMVQQFNKEIHLLNHPWTSTRPHLCSGVHIDVSDACVLVRQKRRQITYSDSDPKQGYDEIMQEIDTNTNWSEAKKRAVKVLVGSRQKNERTFVRCRAKGRTMKSQRQQGPSNCSILDGDFSFEQFNNGYFERQQQQTFKSTVFQERQDVGEQLSANQMLQQWAEETGGNMSRDVQSASPLMETSVKFPMDSEEVEVNCTPTNNFDTLNGSPSASKCVELRDQKRENKYKAKKSVRQIDFNSYPQRRIALLFLYTGWNYEGLVFQDVTENTVEEHIMRVLERSMLVNTRESAQWTRCGRTDKGVSAFRQVAAVTVRSTDTSAEGIFWSMDSDPATRVKSTTELPYVKILNGNLPKSIRILAWCPTHRDFNARFNCQHRIYTYVFPRTCTNLTLMNEGCSRLMGSHDFRNFCQIDKNRDRVQMCYLRKIFEAKVEEVTDNSLPIESDKYQPAQNPYSLVKLTVKASGFLWHQIRCIVTLLYEIGAGRESPELISQLLDVEKVSARPQYLFANQLPLCLFDCSYPDGNLQWIYDTNVLKDVIMDLQKAWAEQQVKANILRSMISGVSSLEELSGKSSLEESVVQGLEDFIMDHPTPKTYVPIMKRPKCMSLEQRKKDMLEKQQAA